MFWLVAAVPFLVGAAFSAMLTSNSAELTQAQQQLGAATRKLDDMSSRLASTKAALVDARDRLHTGYQPTAPPRRLLDSENSHYLNSWD